MNRSRLLFGLVATSGLAACDAILGINHDYTQGDAALDVNGGGEGGDGGPTDAGACSLTQGATPEQLGQFDGSFGIVSDNAFIYVTDFTGNRVLKCLPTEGGCMQKQEWAIPSIAPTLITFEGDKYVGWTDQKPQASTHRLVKVERDGANFDIQAQPFSEVSSLLYSFLKGNAPAGSEGVIFWTDPNIKNVAQYYVTGTPPSNNYSLFVNGENDARALASDDVDIYWIVTGTSGVDIHACTAEYYPLDAYDGGCTPKTVTTNLDGEPVLAIHNGLLYWVDDGGPKVCDPKACAPKQLGGIASQGAPGAIAIDDCALYWTNVSDNSIKRCALPDCAGGIQTIASNQNNPRALAIDATRVYWSTSDTNGFPAGGIWSVPK